MTNNDTRHPAFIKVKTAMLLHVPFFASLLLDIMKVRIGKFPHIFPTGIDVKTGETVKLFETMATDGKTIFIDEDFLTALPVENAVFGVCHEIAHAMWEHMHRAKQYQSFGFDGAKFDPRLWNIATDYVINDLLETSKCGNIKRDAKGKPEWLLNPKYTSTWSGEDVYRDLLQNGMPKGGGAPGGDGQMDVHMYDLSDISDAELKRAIQTAAESAKAMGKLPGSLERFAEQLLAPQITWQELLRTTVVTAATRDTNSWSRPHRRRLVGQGVYLARPSAYGCDRIVVAVDTSGSIGQRELNVFFSELADILRTCRPEVVDVLGADSAVASHEELTGDTDITQDPPKVGGGGGTNFNPVFEWVEEHDIRPDALVYFTDLHGPGPSEEPGYPVIWCSTTPELKGDIGTTIYVDIPST